MIAARGAFSRHGLQDAFKRLDPWLDAAFPVATTLICTKQRLAGYSVLVIFLLLRLLTQPRREPLRWVLISLLAANAGLIIEDRDLKPGGASDYLIIALSFASGLERSRNQWQKSFSWIASCAIPLLAFSLLAGDKMIQLNSSFTGFNINRISFLAGLLAIIAYGLLSQAKTKGGKCAALLFLLTALGEAAMTESRAAIAAPITAIIIDQLSRLRWTPKRLALSLIIAATISIGTLQSWYSTPLGKQNIIADLNRVTTIQCWIGNSLSSPEKLILGIGYGKSASKLCGPDRLPGLIDSAQPLPHSHNLYVQVLAETGLTGLSVICALTLIAFRRAWKGRSDAMKRFSLPTVTYIFLMAIGSTWQAMLLNQILIGYCLAAATSNFHPNEKPSSLTPGNSHS